MEITAAQFAQVEHCLPTQRGNVSLSNLQVLNAILYVAEHGCKWRGLPKRFGNWHTIYTRMSRWSKAGVLDRVFEQLQQSQIVRIKIEAVSLDSTSIKAHPDGTGALKKRTAGHRQVPRRMEHQDSSGCRGCSHGRDLLAVAGAGARRPRGRALLRRLGAPNRPLHLLMDRAYEGNETRQLALDLGFIPVVTPLKTRIEPWEYDRTMYKRRNEVERLFRRLKGYRCIFSRFEKLDVMFIGFISFALIADGLRLC
jgi:transposase